MRFVLATLLLSLAGCTGTEEAAPVAPGGEAPVAPPAEGAPAGTPEGDAAATPTPGGDPAAAPPPGGEPTGLPGTPAEPAGFASLIAGGKSVTLSGTVKGQTVAQVEFAHLVERQGQKVPEVVEVVKITDGKFSVQVPATYEPGIFVSAVVDKKGDGPSPDDLTGGNTKPVKLAGKDETIEITVATGNAWMKDLPWTDPTAPDPGGREAPGGGAMGVGPAGPPPAGGRTPPPPPEGGTPAAPPSGATPPSAPN